MHNFVFFEILQMEKEVFDLYDQLCESIKKYQRDAQFLMLEKAFLFAYDAHKDQKRISGEPYIIHPLHAALHLTRIEADEKTIVWALLHDVLDNSKIDVDVLQHNFWKEIADLVIWTYQLSKIYYQVDMTDWECEALKRKFVTAGNDIRMFLIKIADRLHNLQTLQYLPQQKRYRIAKESEQLYLPILNFLSIWEFLWEFNELCFQYIDEKQYKKLNKIFGKDTQKYEQIIIKAYEKVASDLDQIGIRYNISSRIKSLHSLYKKIEGKNLDIGNVYDFLAMRILCEKKDDCYRILWHIHQLFQLKEDKFKDYISMPKENGYQSLHTTVYDHDGNMLEFQIQTYEMFELNKTGMAAHFMYKWFGLEFSTLPEWMKWILDIQKHTIDSKWFLEQLRNEVLTTDIKCFDQDGKTYTLPKGSIVLDFLFAQWEKSVLYFEKVIVNGKTSSDLYTELKNGDKIHIETSEDIYLKYRVESLLFMKTAVAQVGMIKILKRYAKHLLLDWWKFQLNIALTDTMGKDFSLLPEKIQKSVMNHFWLYDQWMLYFSIATKEIHVETVIQYITSFTEISDVTHEISFKVGTKIWDPKIVAHFVNVLSQLWIEIHKIKYNHKRGILYLDIFVSTNDNYDELVKELRRLPNVAEVYRIFPTKLLLNCVALSVLLCVILINIFVVEYYAYFGFFLFFWATLLLFWLILMRMVTKKVFHYFYKLKRGVYFIFFMNSFAFLSVFSAFIYWKIHLVSLVGFSFLTFLMFFLLFYNIFLTYSLYYRNK